MRWLPRDRPLWLRARNAAGRVRSALGLGHIRLDTAELMEGAVRRTGLSDFGGEGFLEPLQIFVDALDGEADLTPIGRVLARDEVTNWLVNRLEMTAAQHRHPEIADGEIRAPVFVTGSGRSGTSILHELLSQDPAHRVVRHWEALHPCPPPLATSYDDDPRIRRADRDVKRWERIAPAYATMHDGGGSAPQECIYLMAHEFRSDLLAGTYQVPSYAAWLARCDMGPAYALHRRMLQLLQWRCPGERWVLKAPSHLWTLQALLAEYPDARIVQTHRDPLRVAASMTSLAATLYWMRSDQVDVPQIARRSMRSIAFMLERSMQQRREGLLPEAQIFDVRYTDLMADPVGMLRRLYDHFGMKLTPEAESRMRSHLEQRPQSRRGAHRYSFEDTGLDREAERQRFANYQRHFDVESEI